jgi:hypothetical protein
MNRITGPDYSSWSHKPEPDTDRRARQREYATNVLPLCIIAVCAGAWGLFVATTTWVVKCVWEG